MRFLPWSRGVLLALPLLMVSQGALSQEQPPAEQLTGDEGWSRVGQLADSQKVGVLMLDRSWLTGTVQDWQTETFSLRQSRGRTEVIRRDNVQRVSALAPVSRKRGALIGALVGFGAGFAIGAATAGFIADESHPSFGMRAEGGTACGAMFAGIGALVGALRPGEKHSVLYRASAR